jgi:signal transduction histidine kinase
MEMTRRSLFVYVLLAAVWALVLVWQVEEHARVEEAARTDLRNRSKAIARSVGACLRAGLFRGTVLEERLQASLDELVTGHTNEIGHPTELISVVLLNAAGEPLLSAGKPVDLEQRELVQEGERWGQHSVTLINPVDLGASLSSEGLTNPAVILPRHNEFTNRVGELSRDFPRRGPEPDSPGSTNLAASSGPTNGEARGGRFRDSGGRSRRPPWLRGMDEKEYQALREKQSLHGLVLAMSTEGLQAATTRDYWLRCFIVVLATVSALGSGLSWRNLIKNSDLQIRLVRASEQNTHLKEMNLAAAGLAHETRNPLNIIRGLAQMVSKQPEAAPEVRQKSRDIIDQADKVAAQLNEFINYSRPREVRRVKLPLNTVIHEVVRTLNYDLEEKKILLEVQAEPLTIEADEQLLRQTLFNLLLNSIQAVNGNGAIQVIAKKRNATEGLLEIRDNGPGVAPEHRTEIFKPYFTTQKTGTGLGLAVVQQIVQAHGWEIQCLANEPSGAVFRLSHLRLATQ